MKYAITIILAALICIGCNKNATYAVNGTLTGIEDGKILIQEYLGQSKYKNIDSAEILGGKFTLKGSVDHPRSVIIGVEGRRSKTSFWLENSKIAFKSNADSLFKAEISGSEAHDEYLVEP